MSFMFRDFRWVDTWDNGILNLFYEAVVSLKYKRRHPGYHENRLTSNLQFSALLFFVLPSLCSSCSGPRESGISKPTPANWEPARGASDMVSGKCFKHDCSLLFLLTATSTTFDYIHYCNYIRLHWLFAYIDCSTTSPTVTMSTTFTCIDSDRLRPLLCLHWRSKICHHYSRPIVR
jgi:hypothetical protein